MPDAGDAEPLIRIFCQACGRPVVFSPRFVGRKARCLQCGHTFRVPALGGAKPRGGTRRSRVDLEVRSDAREAGVGALLGVETASPDGTAAPAVDTETPGRPLVIGEGQDVELSSPLLFLQGLGLSMIILAVLVLLFWLLHWAVVLWLLLPWAAAFGPGLCRRMTFLLTAGTVRL